MPSARPMLCGAAMLALVAIVLVAAGVASAAPVKR
jgi:hypothetical protein